jgi:osmoprotectant transport system ATP-binding protein
VLENFKFYPNETLNILNQQNKEFKSITFEQLMLAFSKYKNLQPHE